MHPRSGERYVALTLLAMVLFSPLVPALCARLGFVVGLPAIFTGLFVVWIAVVALLALLVRRRGER
jgi:hypothetical protein